MKTPVPLQMDELHCHLYGCLTAHDIWHLGRVQLKNKKELLKGRLEWYAKEFEQSFGVEPASGQYWRSCIGVEDIARDYRATTPLNFAQFQAKFNLLIALFPLDPNDLFICEEVLLQQRRLGIEYGEYRVPVPPHFGKHEARSLWTQLAKCCQNLGGGDNPFDPRIVVSLNRLPESFVQQYQWLKQWQKDHPELNPMIVGIDLCGFEENFPPPGYRDQVLNLALDNQVDPQTSLALLAHGGETRENLTIASSARWVFEWAELGAHRIGHGVSLGLDPWLLESKQWQERVGERRWHLHWLMNHQEMLGNGGYEVDLQACQKELDGLPKEQDYILKGVYDESMCAATELFQNALMKAWPSTVIIECCPTSNLLLAGVPSLEAHPIKRFLDADVPVSIASDDPGMFDTTLVCEQTSLLDAGVLDDLALAKVNRTTAKSRSPLLTGRPL